MWPADHPALTDERIQEVICGAEELAPDGEVGMVLRYVPGRRITTIVSTQRGSGVLKLYARPRARGTHRRLVALAEAGLAELMPEPWGVSADGRAGLVAWAVGETWHDLPDETWVAAARRVGAALRRLHGSSVDLGRSWTAADEVDQLLGNGPGRVAHLAARAALIAPLRERLVPAHRDLHTKQVVVELASDSYPERIRFIDLDDATMAPAGLDVGNLLAHLRVEAVKGARASTTVERAQRAFEVGYGPLPVTHRRWQVLTLVRLAGLAIARGADEGEIHSLSAFATKELDAIGAPLAPPEPVGMAASQAALRTAIVKRGAVVTTAVSDLNPRHPDRSVLAVGTSMGEVVAKVVGHEAIAAHRLLTELWRGPLGASALVPSVPEPLGVVGPLVLMSRLSGRPMATRGTLPEDHEQDVARLLAGLHATNTSRLKKRDAAAIVRSVERKVAEMPRDRAGWYEPVVEAMARTADAASVAPLVTGHGDFAPRNVLAGPNGLSLVDFDRVTLAPVDRDLAYWGAWCWTTSLTIGRRPQWDAGNRLLQSYLDFAPDRGAGGAIGFHRAAALVRIAHGWSALQGESAAPYVRVIAHEALRWALRAGKGSDKGRQDSGDTRVLGVADAASLGSPWR